MSGEFPSPALQLSNLRPHAGLRLRSHISHHALQPCNQLVELSERDTEGVLCA